MTLEPKLEAIIKEYRKQFMARYRVPAHRVDQVIANELAGQTTYLSIELALKSHSPKEDKQPLLYKDENAH